MKSISPIINQGEEDGKRGEKECGKLAVQSSPFADAYQNQHWYSEILGTINFIGEKRDIYGQKDQYFAVVPFFSMGHKSFIQISGYEFIYFSPISQSISPGRTETNFLHTALGSENAARAYSTMENLQPEDVADSVLHVLASPPHVQVQ